MSGLWGWWSADNAFTDSTKTVRCSVSGVDPCYTLADKSGNSRDLVQATLANRPLWVSSVLAGRPSLRFDGSNDFLQITTGTRTMDMSYFWVGKQISWTLNDAVMGPYNTGASGGRYIYNGDTTPEFRLVGPGFNNANWALSTFAACQAGWNQGTNTAFSKVNNTASVFHSGSYSSISTCTGFELGSTTGGTGPSNIEICEVLVYDSVTIGDGSATQRQVMNYLSDRYQLGWTL